MTILYLTESHQQPSAYVLVEGMPHPTAGDVVTAIVTSTSTIILRKSAAADQVALT